MASERTVKALAVAATMNEPWIAASQAARS
jgi:hypothetical protein